MAARVPQSGTAQPRACAPALPSFCDQVLHRHVVERQLGVHALELAVLGFELLDPPKLRRLETAQLAHPLPGRRHADAGLAADLFDRNPEVGLLESRDDLRLAELGCASGPSWPGKMPEIST